MPKKYKRKPGIIEAEQFTNNGQAIVDWAEGLISLTDYPTVLNCVTPAGEVHIHVGDYVVKRTDEDFYPIGPDEFKKLYDEVEA